MSNTLNPVEILKLISETELEAFARSLGCPLTTSDLRGELAGAIQNLPRIKVISALVSINGVWLAMMHDVVRFLDECGLSLRTTGCVLVLPTDSGEVRHFLSPQLADQLARFDAKTSRRKNESGWEDVLARFRSSEGWLRQVLRDGEPTHHRRMSHRKMMRAAIREQSTRDLYEDTIRVDVAASERMFSLWRTLDYLRDKLSPLAGLSSLPPTAEKLRTNVERMSSDFGHRISLMRRDRDLWRELTAQVRKIAPWSPGSYDAEELFQSKYWRHSTHWDSWARLIEDVLSMARLESSPEAADLLRLDLLKDRPRLFEVWCMTRILSWYRSWGSAVALECVKEGDPPSWNLNYSVASKPVARVERDGKRWWLFFQLFRTGIERANMPDLALLDGRTPSSDVVWIADPKYSEARGYSRKDYVEVAERYRDAFSAQRVWICEFFPRRDWFGGACYEHGDRFSILTEVQPNGEGSRLLKRELSELHDFPSDDFVLAVDCSVSFMENLSKLEREVVSLSNWAGAVFCFAGSAKEINPEGVDLATIQSESGSLTGGTLLGPLVSALEDLEDAGRSYAELILVTDGEFSDSSSELNARLEKIFSKVELVADKASIVRVAAERSGVSKKTRSSLINTL